MESNARICTSRNAARMDKIIVQLSYTTKIRKLDVLNCLSSYLSAKSPCSVNIISAEEPWSLSETVNSPIGVLASLFSGIVKLRTVSIKIGGLSFISSTVTASIVVSVRGGLPESATVTCKERQLGTCYCHSKL